MPIYEYECKKCGHSFENLVSRMSEADAPGTCPACQSRNVKRRISVCAVGVSEKNTAPAHASGNGGCCCGGGACNMN